MLQKIKSSTYELELHDVIHVVEFCPYEWSGHLLAIGTSSRVVLVSCRFQEESTEVKGLEHVVKREFHHGLRVAALAWSPETNILSVPQLVRFCTAASDRKLRLFTSDMKNEDTCKVIEGHTDYINSVCFQPETGEYIASVSDDYTCRVWDLDGNQKHCFPLTSPGMAVSWHAQDPLKIMVAEKKGAIRFYSMVTHQPFMSLSCGASPLLDADWCHGNLLHVAAMAASDWFLFDTSRSSRPLETKQAHSEGGQQVAWSRSLNHLLATTGRPTGQVKVSNIKTGQVLLTGKIPTANGLSWHHRLPLLAVGGDKKVHFWSVEPV